LTVRAAVIVTTQLAVPVHAPLHPLNESPPSATATSVTDVPGANEAVHVLVQLIPDVSDCTCPVPLTCTVSGSLWVCAKEGEEFGVAGVLGAFALPGPSTMQAATRHDNDSEPTRLRRPCATDNPLTNGNDTWVRPQDIRQPPAGA
jgi:hypothetical protein